jgi:hypothetical protein
MGGMKKKEIKYKNMKIITAREKEVQTIRAANKATAVGKLMLGQIRDWNEFFECDQMDYFNLPRKQLKSGKADVKGRLLKEINLFCSKNFHKFTIKTLSQLYDDIKALRGIEVPLNQFEEKYGSIKSEVLNGNPKHLTVSITLWGLQFKYPEDMLSKDLIVSLELLSNSSVQLKEFETKEHQQLLTQRDEVGNLIRKKEFAQRAIVLSVFNLLESYLNGIAWDFFESIDSSLISNKKKKLLQDASSVSIREKLLKYPEIISGVDFVSDELIDGFLDIIKPFRDSLVHSSPFSAPEKFGGYDKLIKIYELDESIAIFSVFSLTNIVQRIQIHLNKTNTPKWLTDLSNAINSKYKINLSEPKNKIEPSINAHPAHKKEGENLLVTLQPTLSGLSEAKAVKYRHGSASDDRR